MDAEASLPVTRVSENRLLRLWHRLQRLPAGRWLFSTVVGRAAPFTGVLRARVDELQPGFCRVSVQERRRLRQHLRSMHAGAVFTFAEMASGLAMAAAVPDGARAIVTGAAIEYLKKARGRLSAEGRCPLPKAGERAAYEAVVQVDDAAGDRIATARITWLVDMRPDATATARGAGARQAG